MPEPLGIEIRNLYKIFGARPRDHVDAVRRGMTKAELNEKATALGIQGRSKMTKAELAAAIEKAS